MNKSLQCCTEASEPECSDEARAVPSENIRERFAELMNKPDRPDDGVIAACVFVYCLTHFRADSYVSFYKFRHGSEPSDTPVPDPETDIEAIGELLRFSKGTNNVGEGGKTVYQMVDDFFGNDPDPFAGSGLELNGNAFEILTSRLMRVYDMLAQLSGQEFTPKNFWRTASSLHFHARSIQDASPDPNPHGTLVILAVFHVLLTLFYRKTAPKQYDELLAKCRILGLNERSVLSSSVKNFLDRIGCEIPPDLDEFYSCVYDNVVELDEKELLGDGLFSRLGLLLYIDSVN